MEVGGGYRQEPSAQFCGFRAGLLRLQPGIDLALHDVRQVSLQRLRQVHLGWMRGPYQLCAPRSARGRPLPWLAHGSVEQALDEALVRVRLGRAPCAMLCALVSSLSSQKKNVEAYSYTRVEKKYHVKITCSRRSHSMPTKSVDTLFRVKRE